MTRGASQWMSDEDFESFALAFSITEWGLVRQGLLALVREQMSERKILEKQAQSPGASEEMLQQIEVCRQREQECHRLADRINAAVPSKVS